jgi:serine/threonine protein kinase
MACSVACVLCSALSLLHSRRLVHRGLSPRNVRLAPDGRAKLINFGALAPLGPAKVLLSTPPCCAPESVHSQPLDGRTDLFALGAMLYYMLIGQHAFAARNFSVRSTAWQLGFTRPLDLTCSHPSQTVSYQMPADDNRWRDESSAISRLWSESQRL